MKNQIRIAILLALTFTLGAATSQARHGQHRNSEAIAALGGFVGGVISAEALNGNCRERSAPVYCDTGYIRPIAKSKCGCGGGHFKEVHRRVWVPGKWGWRWSACGSQRIRYWTHGYWEYRKDRVWVSGHARGCRFH